MKAASRLMLISVAMSSLFDNVLREQKAQLYRPANPIFIPTKKMKINAAKRRKRLSK